jgi:predicted dehydrogenase
MKGERIASPLRVGRMLEGGPMVDCGVHQIDLARWWLGSAVEWQRGIGVWVEDYQAPDHLYLHMGHACGAHTMVEMSFSYNATSREPRTHFQYELIGSDGVIRYNREEHSFELRNSHGTQWLAWHPEKNFGACIGNSLTRCRPAICETCRQRWTDCWQLALPGWQPKKPFEIGSGRARSTHRQWSALSTQPHQTSQVRSIWKNQKICQRPLSRHSLNEPGMKTTKNFFLGVDVLQMKTGKPVARQVSKAW